MFRLTTYGNRGELESAGAAIDQMRLGFSANVWYLDGGWQTLVAGLQGVGREHGATIDASRHAEGAGVKSVAADHRERHAGIDGDRGRRRGERDDVRDRRRADCEVLYYSESG